MFAVPPALHAMLVELRRVVLILTSMLCAVATLSTGGSQSTPVFCFCWFTWNIEITILNGLSKVLSWWLAISKKRAYSNYLSYWDFDNGVEFFSLAGGDVKRPRLSASLVVTFVLSYHYYVMYYHLICRMCAVHYTYLRQGMAIFVVSVTLCMTCN